MTASTVDPTAAKELTLYAENDGRIYEHAQPVIRNLAAKKAKHKYDANRAIDAMQYVADYAAQLYTQEHCNFASYYQLFNKATRQQVAVNLLNGYMEEINETAGF